MTLKAMKVCESIHSKVFIRCGRDLQSFNRLIGHLSWSDPVQKLRLNGYAASDSTEYRYQT